jgi:hypothetical protein
MSQVELDIVGLSYAPAEVDLRGYFNAVVSGGRLRVSGWCIHRQQPVYAVEIVAADAVIATTNTGIERPDVRDLFPDLPAAGTSGFEILVEAGGEGDSELEVEAVTADEARHPLGRIDVAVKAQARSNGLRESRRG